MAATAAPVAAQVPPASGAAAEEMFREGKRQLKAGAIAEGCKAFETSQKLEASVATLMNLADCREQNGELATAWGLFLEVARTTRADAAWSGLNLQAKDRAAKLEPRLSYLTVSVPRESQVEGLQILRDGVAFDEGLWNRAIPEDGGPHVITGKAPGHEPWSTTVSVPTEGGKVTVDVPRFKEVSALIPTQADAGPVQPSIQQPQRLEPITEAPRLTGRRKLAIGTAALGAIALGTGVALGLQAKGLESDALSLCPDDPCGPNAAEANRLGDRAEDRGLLANVGYGVGVAAAGAAAFLWFTGAPHRATVAPIASGQTIGLTASVRF